MSAVELSPPLAALEGRLAEAARAWDDDEFEQAAQEIAEHIDAAADPDAALLELDRLVEARIDGLADAGDTEFADLYGAAVQDFYDACELTVLAAYLGLHRGELMIAADHAAAAEQVIREAHEVLIAHRDPVCPASATLLGRAVALTGRLEDALVVLEAAMGLAQQHDAPEIAAEATDLLGYVCQDLGRQADAARWLGQAAERWLEVGDEEAAAECLQAVAVAEIGLATEAAGRERYDECEPHARRALDAAQGRNEVLAATASVFLGAARLRMGAPREAQELMAPAVDVLRPLREQGADSAVAVALLVLGEALAFQSDIIGADRCYREALDRAREAADDEIAKFAILQLVALASPRLGPVEQLKLLGQLDGSDPRFELLAEHNAGMLAMREENFAVAHSHFERARELARDVPGAAEDGMSLNAFRMLAFLAEGRPDDAERSLAAVDDAFLAAQRQGEAELVAAALPYLEMWHGVMSLGRGDHDEGARRLDRAREQFQAADATMTAVMVSAMRGVHALQRGGPAAAVGHLIPAALAARSELTTLPSSTERAASRSSYYMIVEVAIRAVATTGDQRLMAELLEELQAQSMPLPPTAGAENRSLSALMFGLALDLAGSPPRRIDAGQESRPDVEQDTMLAPSARIRMPWDTIALEPYHDSARRYGEHVVDDTTVTLTVIR